MTCLMTFKINYLFCHHWFLFFHFLCFFHGSVCVSGCMCMCVAGLFLGNNGQFHCPSFMGWVSGSVEGERQKNSILPLQNSVWIKGLVRKPGMKSERFLHTQDIGVHAAKSNSWHNPQVGSTSPKRGYCSLDIGGEHCAGWEFPGKSK